MAIFRDIITRLLFLTAFMLAAGDAFADQSDKLVIGVVPEVNLVKQMERYVPLSDYLDRKLGLDVEMSHLKIDLSSYPYKKTNQ